MEAHKDKAMSSKEKDYSFEAGDWVLAWIALGLWESAVGIMLVPMAMIRLGWVLALKRRENEQFLKRENSEREDVSDTD